VNVHVDCSDYAEELQEMLQCGVKFVVENDTLRTQDYTFTFAPEFAHILDTYKQFHNPLIYGKNTMLGIVAIEVTDDNQLELYLTDGTKKTYPYKPWLLFSEKIDAKCERLEGLLTYKYIRFVEPGENFFRYKDKTFQIWNQKEAAMHLHGMTLFKGLKPSQLGVLSFDIESTGLEQNASSDVFIITNAYEKNGKRTLKHFRQDKFKTTGEMLTAWCAWVREINPDVITGHNIYGYDLPFLDFIARKYRVKLELGRNGEVLTFSKKDREYRVDGNTTWSYKPCHIYGRHIIDTMFLAVKYDFGRQYPSWGLKAIVEHEKLTKPGRTFYDASKIRENWHKPKEREKIVAYAIDDSEDSLNLYNLMIPAYFYMNQSLPIPFEEMMQGATGKWMNSIVVRSYLQEMHSIPKPDDKIYVHGGISFGNPGLYKNVMKVDVTSLYPSCILTYKIFPEKKDPRQNFLNMVQFFTDERIRNKKKFKETKDSYYDGLQAAQKIAINSSYGMLGTNGLQFNDFSAANHVTLRGRSVLRRAIMWASGNDVGRWFKDYDYTKDGGVSVTSPISHDFIIGPTDTDSISFCKPDMGSFTETEQSRLLDELNSLMDKGIVFEDDGYFSQILAVAAKNYCLVENGSSKIKMKGSSIKDAKKEPMLRQFMDEVIDSLLYERGTVPAIYERYCNEARNITDISKWAVKKSISKKLLSSERKQETDVVAALGDVSQYREGDKVFIYNTARKFVPDLDEQGNEQLYKSGKNKGKVKGDWVKVLKLTKDWNNDPDIEHYLTRVYDTLSIFEEVLDMKQFTCYDK
jgi:DNA polymerase I